MTCTNFPRNPLRIQAFGDGLAQITRTRTSEVPLGIVEKIVSSARIQAFLGGIFIGLSVMKNGADKEESSNWVSSDSSSVVPADTRVDSIQNTEE